MATTKQVLDIARKELGVKESPPNSNKVKYNTWFYGREVSGPSYPWCMVWVSWVFSKAKMPLPYKTASCSELLRWYRTNAPSQIFQSPQVGDIVIYNFGHTGIVESVGSGTITAIEGNTSISGSQSNGGEVCRKTRGMKTATAFIRPKYDKEEKKMDNTPSHAHKEGVEWAVKNGILKGSAAGDLMLREPLTREQMCTMLYRFAKSIGKA